MVRREAYSWFVRLRGPRAAELQQSFRRWYDADPGHAAAFDAVSRHFDQSGVARQSEFWRSPSVEPAPAPAAARPRYALAAAIALIVLVPAGMVLSENGIGPFGRPNVLLLATSLGEIRQVKLADGSTVTLDTATAVRIELKRSERRAVLKRGRVRFTVAPDSTPFIVETEGATVTTREAVVDVERASPESRIEVRSGTAAVSGRAGDMIALSQGEGLSTSNGIPAQKYEVTSAQPDWTRGMLQFSATPLGEAVAQANRYSAHRIVLVGDIVELRVTGAYRAGDTEGFARSLAAAFHLTLTRSSPGDFLLARNAESTRPK